MQKIFSQKISPESQVASSKNINRKFNKTFISKSHNHILFPISFPFCFSKNLLSSEAKEEHHNVSFFVWIFYSCCLFSIFFFLLHFLFGKRIILAKFSAINFPFFPSFVFYGTNIDTEARSIYALDPSIHLITYTMQAQNYIYLLQIYSKVIKLWVQGELFFLFFLLGVIEIFSDC